MTTYNNFIGIDIGKFTFFVALHGSKIVKEYDNTEEGINLFIKDFKVELKTALSVLETTGGYEVKLLHALCAKDFTVHRANTRKVKSFVCSHGNSAKTDRLDAKALAKYGFERSTILDKYTPPSQQALNLYELGQRKRDLVKMLVAEKNRFKSPRSNLVKKSCQAMIDYLSSEISAITNEINIIIDYDHIVKAKKETLKAMPGIGDATANELIIFMPELGTLNGKQVASLAGLAPRSNESGKFKGYRSVANGREAIKPALFLAAMAARNSKSDFRLFYEKLIERGKLKVVALVALMRKMLVIANAKLRDLALEQEKESKIAV